MTAINRGNVPAPHLAPGAGRKAAPDPEEEIVFDAGSLSFVQDWVEGGDGQEEPVDAERESGDRSQSNKNRRLGVGAISKKSKQERAEPSALEKKLLKKRQRQEQSDSIAARVGTHGVADIDEDGEGDSKTASFKGRNKRDRHRSQQQQQQSFAILNAKDTNTTKHAKNKKKEGANSSCVRGAGEVSVSADSSGNGPEADEANDGGGGIDGEAEKQGRKRKARRKKGKRAAGNVATDGTVIETQVIAEEVPPPAATAKDAKHSSPEVLVANNETALGEAQEVGTKKQRRGWGKARSASSIKILSDVAGGQADSGAPTDAGGGEEDRKRPRTKTRSRQKNIRKDKRAMDQRPAYLQPGDPGYSGRGLTDETRKFLGLPQDDMDKAPPAGWGKPGKLPAQEKRDSGWVIDTKPNAPLSAIDIREESQVGRTDEGVTVAIKGDSSSARAVGKKKPKYKNLALPPQEA